MFYQLIKTWTTDELWDYVADMENSGALPAGNYEAVRQFEGIALELNKRYGYEVLR
jgi:hypothetical protein